MKKIVSEIIKNHFQPLGVGLIFLLTYFPTFHWMWIRWFERDSYYTHGILIPFVTIYLIWQKTEELKKLKPQRSFWGMALIVFGLLLHMVSSLFLINSSAGFSMIIVLSGVIVYFYGGEIYKKISFPILFLVFMIPLPSYVIEILSFNLKLLAAHIATGILNDLGILAVQQGSLIKMRHAYVVVDDVCSGLRSLISLSALGSIFAYWMKPVVWKRVCVFLSTIPIAVLTNICRIIFLAFVAEVWGSQFTSGFIHDISGLSVFLLAFILLYAVGKVIE